MRQEGEELEGTGDPPGLGPLSLPHQLGRGAGGVPHASISLLFFG